MAVLPKNIWVAAGDGDLDRVRVRLSLLPLLSLSIIDVPLGAHRAALQVFFCPPEYARQIDNQNLHLALSPNMPDPYTYTPMHAAASYGQIHVLEYLLSCGGDINITDSDGDTPLYTVENLETARFLVQHGAIVDRHNLEGVSPIEHLTEEFPQIADYLRSTLDPAVLPSTAATTSPSQHSQNLASEQLTSALMSSVQEIMERAEAEGQDPEEELRQLVSRTVLEGVVTGYEMTVDSSDTTHPRDGSAQDGTPSKRPRNDDSTA
ncbi:Ankyrin repeat-containing protein P1E11.10 [Psilocybe cubensis]|uniref:Ankyrin repeat-containing protein P1E11.10 n=2 Tax=Psilocybe cubensis TaxID=181762 RepID=A0ACB8H162_PSICU|nr:Ankyrin repeat-containing protein P1E11.10 [Psilocybe cubensis]KAH9481432.1 Ankyrin repeat-containing protein P1E11.10 [Psilocybe cubensis]